MLESLLDLSLLVTQITQVEVRQRVARVRSARDSRRANSTVHAWHVRALGERVTFLHLPRVQGKRPDRP